MRYIITQAKRNYVTSISTTNPSQYTEIHLPMISTLHYDYTLNICSRKMFQNSKSYILILRCHMFNGPVCCQAGESIQLQCQGLCAAGRGKVYNSSARACVLPGGGKYTTPVPGPVCCQAGESIQLQCQGLCVARACVLPGPMCCQGLCAAVTGESVATQQDEDFRQSWGGYCWVLLGYCCVLLASLKALSSLPG